MPNKTRERRLGSRPGLGEPGCAIRDVALVPRCGQHRADIGPTCRSCCLGLEFPSYSYHVRYYFRLLIGDLANPKVIPLTLTEYLASCLIFSSSLVLRLSNQFDQLHPFNTINHHQMCTRAPSRFVPPSRIGGLLIPSAARGGPAVSYTNQGGSLCCKV